MKRIILLTATAVGILAAPALLAQMNHSDHAAHQHDPGARSEHATPLPGLVQGVLTNYLNIQTALARDSLQGVKQSAERITESIQKDSAKTFSAEAARAAGDLAKSSEINAARLVFKRLSGALIRDFDAHREYAGHFLKASCPMANAMWLQAGTTVNNPYLGKSMARCGRIEG